MSLYDQDAPLTLEEASELRAANIALANGATFHDVYMDRLDALEARLFYSGQEIEDAPEWLGVAAVFAAILVTVTLVYLVWHVARFLT